MVLSISTPFRTDNEILNPAMKVHIVPLVPGYSLIISQCKTICQKISHSDDISLFKENAESLSFMANINPPPTSFSVWLSFLNVLYSGGSRNLRNGGTEKFYVRRILPLTVKQMQDTPKEIFKIWVSDMKFTVF